MSTPPKPTFSDINPWPSRSLAEPNYDIKADLANDSYELFHDELAVAIPWFEDTRDRAEDAATTASNAATSASAAQTAAENAASATAWVSGGSYTQGDVHWSLIDYLPYRAKTTHSGLTTDPSEDDTNWAVQGIEPADVIKPTNVSPANAATGLGSGPILTGSEYGSLYGLTQAASQWQVSTAADFSTTVVDTGDVAGVGVTYTVPSGTLSVSTTYYWRCRYKDPDGVYSDWSNGTSFTTAASFVPSVIGEAIEGGFYAGNIVEGGTEYYIIVAPKALGESSSQQFKTSRTASPTATQTLNNGPAATAAMVSAGSHPAAAFCDGLTIGGFSDWYLPARDELELLYRNLKPTTNSNFTGDRGKTSITYPEGDDLSADTHGVNRNSSPTGAAYTSGDLAQTSVTDFVAGGTEAFESAYYKSSSEYAYNFSWSQSLNNGNQSDDFKDSSGYVRAVRRVPV